MFARDVGRFKEWLERSPLCDDRLWSRPLEAIGPNEIQLFYARAGLLGLRSHAAAAIDQLQSELITAAVEGGVPATALRLIKHETPRDPYTVEEFVDALVRLPMARRMATIMALETRTAPETIMAMEWKEARQARQLTSLASEVLQARSRLRHYRLPYVFWEWASETVAAPLIQLRETAEEAFERPWPTIQLDWCDMIWIDGRADAGGFLSVVNEVRTGKL